MIKCIKLSLISRTNSCQINQQNNMCGERESLRAECNRGKVTNGMSRRLFNESVSTIRAILCPCWSNSFHAYFMQKTKMFIPALPIILSPLIFLFVFLSLPAFHFFPVLDIV